MERKLLLNAVSSRSFSAGGAMSAETGERKAA